MITSSDKEYGCPPVAVSYYTSQVSTWSLVVSTLHVDDPEGVVKVTTIRLVSIGNPEPVSVSTVPPKAFAKGGDTVVKVSPILMSGTLCSTGTYPKPSETETKWSPALG